MRLAMKLPPKGAQQGVANDVDPREEENLDVIDLASRNAYPVVAGKRGRMDGMGMVAGIALVAGIGLVTLWSMSSARLDEPEGVGNPQLAAPAAVVTPAPPVVLQPGPQVAPPPVLTDPAPSPVFAAPPNPVAAAAPGANPNSSATVVFDSTAAPGLAV